MPELSEKICFDFVFVFCQEAKTFLVFSSASSLKYICVCVCVCMSGFFVLVFAGRKKGQRGKVTLLSALFNAAKTHTHTRTSTHGDYVHIFKYIYMRYTYGNNTVLTHSHAHTKWMGGHIYMYFFGDDLQQIARVCVCAVVRGEIV